MGRKSIMVALRYSPEELEKVKQQMRETGFKSRSKFIRFMSLNGFIVAQDTSSFDSMINAFEKVERELNAIGNNINQIARKLNTDDDVLVDEFIEIKNNLKHLRGENSKNFDKIYKENKAKKERSVINGLR